MSEKQIRRNRKETIFIAIVMMVLVAHIIFATARGNMSMQQNKEQQSTQERWTIDKYGMIQDALTAYNYGETGAKTHLWNNGIYIYEYNSGIINRMKEIEEELNE